MSSPGRLPSGSGNWPIPRLGPRRISCLPTGTMAYMIGWTRGKALGLSVLAVLAPRAPGAQVPLPPEMAAIAACLCLQQAVSTLSADMTAKNQALDTVTGQLSDLDAQLARERSAINVN